MQLALILYIRHIQFISVQYTEPLSFPLFFLTPPFTHSTIFYCLQTVRHTRTLVSLPPVLCAAYATTRHYQSLPALLLFSQNHTQSNGIDFV